MKLTEITPKMLKGIYNATQLRISIRELAFDMVESANPEDFFILEYDFKDLKSPDGNHYFIVLNKKSFNEVNPRWTYSDLQNWLSEQHIFDRDVAYHLTTDPSFIKMVKSKKSINSLNNKL